ncbi:hypothetical protein HMPREF3187_00667 [Aerococcus christensenii]|uniref:Uncharacterized protein n=1 Tax=Aerococcus christensenii TaxID=87541 RepID=A0A133Y216_9LACT|nr:hypothetical protein HMPREF3187_00667 [Aerococcus christensenii]
MYQGNKKEIGKVQKNKKRGYQGKGDFCEGINWRERMVTKSTPPFLETIGKYGNEVPEFERSMTIVTVRPP